MITPEQLKEAKVGDFLLIDRGEYRVRYFLEIVSIYNDGPTLWVVNWYKDPTKTVKTKALNEMFYPTEFAPYLIFVHINEPIITNIWDIFI